MSTIMSTILNISRFYKMWPVIILFEIFQLKTLGEETNFSFSPKFLFSGTFLNTLSWNCRFTLFQFHVLINKIYQYSKLSKIILNVYHTFVFVYVCVCLCVEECLVVTTLIDVFSIV